MTLLSALALGACGDDDVQPFDGGSDVQTDIAADTTLPDIDIPDNNLGDMNTPDMDTPDAPDGGMDVEMDTSMDMAMDMAMDMTMMDAGDPMMGSMNIADVIAADEGVLDPALMVGNVIVTYVRPEVGNDPAGFFVQAEQEGPALFIAVNPTTLTPTPEVGDAVMFNVTEKEVNAGQQRVLAISDFMRLGQGIDVSSFDQNISALTDADLIDGLDDYTSELVTATGTVTGSFGFGGTGHQRIQLVTAGIDDSDLVLRMSDDALMVSPIYDGCMVTAGPTPLWRFNGTAQVNVIDATELDAITCPAPTVLSATATGPTEVVVSFSAALDPASVAAADFTLDNGLTVSDIMISADGLSVTLVTSMQTEGTDYTLTVSGVTELFGTDIDGTMNSAMFVGAGDGVGALLITEVVEGSSNNKAIEITNVGDAAMVVDGCELFRHTNGSATASSVYTFAGAFTAGQSYVICNTSIDAGLGATCDDTAGITHTGNDAYVLSCGGTVVDTFGVADGSGDNFTGTNSMGQAISASNMTVRRLCSVTAADADVDVTDAFDLALQWDVSTPADPAMSINDVSDLGMYTCP